MTLTPSDVYWITRLDNFGCIGWIVIFICIVVAVCFIVNTDWEALDNEKSYAYEDSRLKLKYIKRCGLVLAVTVGILAFIPSTKEAAMMYALPKVVNSEVVKEDIPELYELGIKAAKEWLSVEQTRAKE